MDSQHDLMTFNMAMTIARASGDDNHSNKLSEAQKEEIINRAKDTKSGDEVQEIINELSIDDRMS